MGIDVFWGGINQEVYVLGGSGESIVVDRKAPDDQVFGLGGVEGATDPLEILKGWRPRSKGFRLCSHQS
jgi:hypothetical protein